jgi:transketolase
MEGISHEAIGLAGKQKLSRLIVLWDDNGISIDGKVALSDVTDQLTRFAAAGWSTHACDGHDPEDIDRALAEAKASDLPAFVACRTHIGFGAPTKQGTKAAHGSPLGADEIVRSGTPTAGPPALRDPRRGAGGLARHRRRGAADAPPGSATARKLCPAASGRSSTACWRARRRASSCGALTAFRQAQSEAGPRSPPARPPRWRWR